MGTRINNLLWHTHEQAYFFHLFSSYMPLFIFIKTKLQATKGWLYVIKPEEDLAWLWNNFMIKALGVQVRSAQESLVFSGANNWLHRMLKGLYLKPHYNED